MRAAQRRLLTLIFSALPLAAYVLIASLILGWRLHLRGLILVWAALIALTLCIAEYMSTRYPKFVKRDGKGDVSLGGIRSQKLLTIALIVGGLAVGFILLLHLIGYKRE